MIACQRGDPVKINSAAVIRCGVIRNRDIGSIKFCSGFFRFLRIHANHQIAASHINACAMPGCKHITGILHLSDIIGCLEESLSVILRYCCISNQIQSSIRHINPAALIGDSIPNGYAVQCQYCLRTGKPDYAAVVVNTFIDTFVFGTIRIIVVGNIAAWKRKTAVILAEQSNISADYIEYAESAGSIIRILADLEYQIQVSIAVFQSVIREYFKRRSGIRNVVFSCINRHCKNPVGNLISMCIRQRFVDSDGIIKGGSQITAIRRSSVNIGFSDIKRNTFLSLSAECLAVKYNIGGEMEFLTDDRRGGILTVNYSIQRIVDSEDTLSGLRHLVETCHQNSFAQRKASVIRIDRVIGCIDNCPDIIFPGSCISFVIFWTIFIIVQAVCIIQCICCGKVIIKHILYHQLIGADVIHAVISRSISGKTVLPFCYDVVFIDCNRCPGIEIFPGAACLPGGNALRVQRIEIHDRACKINCRINSFIGCLSGCADCQIARCGIGIVVIVNLTVFCGVFFRILNSEFIVFIITLEIGIQIITVFKNIHRLYSDIAGGIHILLLILECQAVFDADCSEQGIHVFHCRIIGFRRKIVSCISNEDRVQNIDSGITSDNIHTAASCVSGIAGNRRIQNVDRGILSDIHTSAIKCSVAVKRGIDQIQIHHIIAV